MLEEIGTPAKKPKPRGNPKGRVLGAAQEKRPKKEVIFKSKRDEKCINAGHEKSSKNSDAKKIDKLLKSVTTQLENSDLTLEAFCEKLLDSA